MTPPDAPDCNHDAHASFAAPSGSAWREHSDPPPVGQMVLSQDNDIVWWGGVNWYSRRTQNTTRVLCWRPISTTADIVRGGIPSVDMSFMDDETPNE